MKITETNLGYLIQTQNFTVLLGGEKSQIINLKSSFPEFQFIRIKQSHGDTLVHSEDPRLDYQVEADGHYTSTPKLALCVSTADCIPLLIYDASTETIAAIHAGWRGVANQIVPKAIRHLQSGGSQSEQLQVIIGPHIQMASFEVENTVRDQILSSIDFGATLAESIYHKKTTSEKSLVDLNQVLKTQLQNSGILFDNLYNLHIDTFIDHRFHSYRRDKELSGRQISFICKN